MKLCKVKTAYAYPFQHQLCFLVLEDSHSPKNTNTPVSYEDIKESIR